MEEESDVREIIRDKQQTGEGSKLMKSILHVFHRLHFKGFENVFQWSYALLQETVMFSFLIFYLFKPYS